MITRLLSYWLHRLTGCRCVTVRWKFGKITNVVPNGKKPPRQLIIQSKRRRVPNVSFPIPYSSQFPIEVELLDDKGKPAKVDGVPVWATDNPAILTVVPAPDGMSCNVQSTGVLGTATVQFSADADLGAGVKEIIGTLEVEVTARGATTVVLKPGAVTDIPDAPPAP